MLSAVRLEQLEELINRLNLGQIDKELLNIALTHSSYNFEENKNDAPNYERLEFLGDSVLRLFVSELIYDKYEEYPEGKLTKIRSRLVSDSYLANMGEGLGIKEYINIGRHEEKDGGRDKESIIACVMEAMLGAIYKSRGAEFVKEFIYRLYKDRNLEEEIKNYNPKELLQEYTQGKNKDLPEYKLIKETGKAHNKNFEVKVEYRGEELGLGEGKTKKEAEKMAAYNALKYLQILKDENNE